MQSEYDIKRVNVDWKTENLARSFILALFNAHDHDYSQHIPGLDRPEGAFFSPQDRPCSRAFPELIYYGGRNVPVMLTPVIGNNVCRERIEKEKERRARRKRMDSTSFFTPGDPFNLRRIRAPCKVSRKLKLRMEFSGNVTGETREITLAELNFCRHYAHTLHTMQSHINFCDCHMSRVFSCFIESWRRWRKKRLLMMQSHISLETNFIIALWMFTRGVWLLS